MLFLHEAVTWPEAAIAITGIVCTAIFLTLLFWFTLRD